MTRFSRRSGQVQTPQRRATLWTDGPGGDDITTLDVSSFTSTTVQVLGLGISTGLRSTIQRIRGYVSLQLTAANAIGDGFNWALGIGIASSDAFASGVGALPDPFSDKAWPGWMWMASGSIFTSVGALAVGDPSINPVTVQIDSKAQRIWRQNEVVFCPVRPVRRVRR